MKTPPTFTDRLIGLMRKVHARTRTRFVPTSWTTSGDPTSWLFARIQSNFETTAQRVQARMLEPHGLSLSLTHARDIVCALVERHQDWLAKFIKAPLDQAELHAAIDVLFAKHPALFRAHCDSMRGELTALQITHSHTDQHEARRRAETMQPDRLRRHLYVRRENLCPERNDAS